MVRSRKKKKERNCYGLLVSRTKEEPTGLTVTRGQNDNNTLTIGRMSVPIRVYTETVKLKLKLIRSLHVNHRGLIIDDIKLMFVRMIKKKLWFLLCITCAVRFCELRPRAAGCEDLWQRDVGGDKVGKTRRATVSSLLPLHCLLRFFLFLAAAVPLLIARSNVCLFFPSPSVCTE